MQNASLPAGLQSPTFGEKFAHTIDDVTLPATLQNLTFGDVSHQMRKYDLAIWPAEPRFWQWGHQCMET
jgi:hypothetical protein